MNGTALRIAELCLDYFKQLPKSGKPNGNEWTVLSCIVKEQNENFEVVALGTGTKCIGINQMCADGTILNDSHAEVICRRAFLRYIYHQLKKDSEIFVVDKKITLKTGVLFHFFSTHVPCGDAAIFQNQDTTEFGDVLDTGEIHSKIRKIETDSRTGAKCLMTDVRQDLKISGSNYHVTGVVRTKPGRGDPTISVSCSDKLAKWCHLGIQGALLMIFLDQPIYLTSFIIVNSTPFNKKSLERALYGRLTNLNLVLPFKRNILSVHQVPLNFAFSKCPTKRPCPTSIISYRVSNTRSLQVAVNGKKQGVTKKNLNSEKATLDICKQNIFKIFLIKLNEFNFSNDASRKHLSYSDAKKLSIDYMDNWNKLKENFKAWSVKNPEFYNF